MNEIIETIIKWIDEVLPVFLLPWGVILFIRIFYQIITH